MVRTKKHNLTCNFLKNGGYAKGTEIKGRSYYFHYNLVLIQRCQLVKSILTIALK